VAKLADDPWGVGVGVGVASNAYVKELQDLNVMIWSINTTEQWAKANREDN